MTQLDDESFDSFLQKNRLSLVLFSAPWASPCAEAMQVFEILEQRHGKQIGFATVNVDHAQEIIERYAIVAVPTILGFKDGQLIDRVMGSGNADTIETMIPEIIREASPPTVQKTATSV